MKRVLKGIFAAALSVGLCFSTVGCGDVKDGSKIEKCVVTLVSEGKEIPIEVELYMNYTGSTIEHFKYLAGKNYYDGTIVSNAKDYVEFGLLDSSRNALDEKYASIITNDYASKLTFVNDNTRKRYTSANTIVGEFYKNGFQDKNGKNANPLTLDGALVLKRGLDKVSVDGQTIDEENTGKGVFAFTFGTTSYFSSADEFAILGKVVKDNATDDEKSSYDRLKALMTDNASNEYYYTFVCKEVGHKCNEYGHRFRKTDDGDIERYVNGEWVVMDSEDENEKTFLEEFDKNGKYASVLPKTEITVKSIEFKKK